MARVDTCCPEVHRTPRVRRRHDRSAAALSRPFDRRQLAFPDRRCDLGLQCRVGATCAAAQAIVVQLDDVDIACEDTPDRSLGPLDVAKVARVLDRSRAGAPASAAGSSSTRSAEPLMDVAHPAGERRRLWGAEQVPEVLHRRPTAGGVDQHRSVARECGDHVASERSGVVEQPRMGMQGTTTGGAGRRP